MWTDRTGFYKIEAQYLGLGNNKIILHKSNGFKIAVDVDEMSSKDIEYSQRELW